MANYKHILLATDFNSESTAVAQRAKAMAESNQCELSITHVIEPISIAYGGEFPVDLGGLHRELEAQGRNSLDTLSDELNIPTANRHLKIGITEKEILNLAKDGDIDLIILGSHGKHGFSLLLGSTANGVLHHAECDVLAVRVHDK